MALKSLMVHSAGNQTNHSSGVTPFDGNAAHFYQWEFKTLMKAQQLQDPAAPDAAPGTRERNAKVVDGIISGLTHKVCRPQWTLELKDSTHLAV